MESNLGWDFSTLYSRVGGGGVLKRSFASSFVSFCLEKDQKKIWSVFWSIPSRGAFQLFCLTPPVFYFPLGGLGCLVPPPGSKTRPPGAEQKNSKLPSATLELTWKNFARERLTVWGKLIIEEFGIDEHDERDYASRALQAI